MFRLVYLISVKRSLIRSLDHNINYGISKVIQHEFKEKKVYSAILLLSTVDISRTQIFTKTVCPQSLIGFCPRQSLSLPLLLMLLQMSLPVLLFFMLLSFLFLLLIMLLIAFSVTSACFESLRPFSFSLLWSLLLMFLLLLFFLMLLSR